MNQRLLSGVASAAAALGPGTGEALAQPQALLPTKPHVETYQTQIEATSGIGIDEPLGLEILEGAVGIALLARVGRGLRIRRDYKSLDNKALSVSIGIRRVQELSVRQAADLAEDEPQVGKLYGIRDDLEQRAEQLENARETFRDHYSQAARRIWPNKGWVKGPGSIIDVATIRAKMATDDSHDKQRKLASKADAVHASVQGFGGEVSSMNNRAQEMRDSGWNLGRLEDDISAANGLPQEVDQLENAGHISQAKQFVKRHGEEVAATYETIDGLPDRREQADASIDTLDQRLEASARLVDYAKAELASMAETYDASCYADLQKRGKGLDDALQSLERYSRRAQNHRGELSFKALERSESLIAKFTRVQAVITEAAVKVQQRALKLADIEANLPNAIAGIEEGLAKTHNYAFEKHADDVEDDTRQGVTDLQKRVANLKTQASADKPAYLELDETAGAYQEAAEQIHRQAKEQRQEMKDLRTSATDSVSEIRDIDRSISRMLAAENDYGMGVWAEMDPKHIKRLRDRVQIPEVQTDLSRAELREQHGRVTGARIEADEARYAIRRYITAARERKIAKERTRAQLGPMW